VILLFSHSLCYHVLSFLFNRYLIIVFRLFILVYIQRNARSSTYECVTMEKRRSAGRNRIGGLLKDAPTPGVKNITEGIGGAANRPHSGLVAGATKI
ncbi:hypothetical protein PMAYCL1PPCAC_33268, partial [Pristionchus mayeri]